MHAQLPGQDGWRENSHGRKQENGSLQFDVHNLIYPVSFAKHKRLSRDLLLSHRYTVWELLLEPIQMDLDGLPSTSFI